MTKKITILLPLFFIFLVLTATYAEENTEDANNPVPDDIYYSNPVTEQSTSVSTNLGLYGATTWDIEVDANSGNIYLATKSPNGFFKSTDGGATWSGLPEGADYGQGSDVEVNPETGYIYALLTSVIISKDYGETFKEINSFNDNEAMEASSILYAQNRLLVGRSNGKVEISEDDGDNFTAVTIDEGNDVISLAATNDTIYALTQERYSSEPAELFKSTDAGNTWTDLNIGLEDAVSLTKVAVNPVDNTIFLIPGSEGGTTYRSADGGATWSALSTDAPATGYISFDSTGRIYIGWNYSDDNGDTWTQFNDGGDYGHLIAVDPADDNILYDTSIPGFSKSTDRGLTWTDSVAGITAVTVTSISQAKDKNIVWVATQNGLAKTTNFLSGAPDWEYPINPTNSENFISSGKDSVFVHPENTDIIVAGVSAAMWQSSDGGSTWQQVQTEIDLNGTVAHEITSSADGSVFYAAIGRSAEQGTNGGVLQSADNGLTWMTMNFPDDGAVLSVTVAKDGDIFGGAGSGTGDMRGIYKYNATNESWTQLNAPTSIEYAAVLTDPEAPDTIYALGVKTPSDETVGFYKSTDDGENFTHITNGLENAYEYSALTIQKSTTPNNLYIAALDDLQGRVYKSSDGGESWGILYQGLKLENFYALLFDGLTAGNNRGLYSVDSKANLQLRASKANSKKPAKKILTVNLKDAATGRVLKNRQVKIYRKISGARNWQLFKKVKTNKNGKAILKVQAKKNTRFKAIFTPKSSSDRAEFTTSQSGILKMK